MASGNLSLFFDFLDISYVYLFLLNYLEFKRRLLEDLPEEVEPELLAVEHVQPLVPLDVLQPQLQLGLNLPHGLYTKAWLT